MDRETMQQIVDLLMNIPKGHEQRIREYSDAKCNYYDVPFIPIHSFLLEAYKDPMALGDLTSFQGRSEFQAIVDLVEKSILSRVLQIDANTAVLSFRDSVEKNDRIELSDFVALHTGGIG